MASFTYSRPHLAALAGRLAEPVRLIQILAGPRQVGKTTLIHQLVASRPKTTHMLAAADQSEAPSGDSAADRSTTALVVDRPSPQQLGQWLTRLWNEAREKARSPTVADPGEARPFALIIDEIQKIPNWSELVKGLWDADRAEGLPLHVVLLGSSPLLMQKGLTESLAGRYELIPMRHWSLTEMQDAFDVTLEEYLYFGGYPGAIVFMRDEERWRNFVIASLIQPSIERDVLMMARVEKPALLKRLFELGCNYSGQILAFTKMQGQLQDAGNTTTLAHYLDLLAQSGLISGLQKFSGQAVRQRASSPKLNVQNTALMTAGSGYTFAQAQLDRSYWGRVAESAVGAHLINSAALGVSVQYWRDSPHEVDFILSQGQLLTAIEVKSGRASGNASGLERFAQTHKTTRSLVVGNAAGCDVSMAEFMSYPAAHWLEPAS